MGAFELPRPWLEVFNFSRGQVLTIATMKLCYLVIFIATFFLPIQECKSGPPREPVESEEQEHPLVRILRKRLEPEGDKDFNKDSKFFKEGGIDDEIVPTVLATLISTKEVVGKSLRKYLQNVPEHLAAVSGEINGSGKGTIKSGVTAIRNNVFKIKEQLLGNEHGEAKEGSILKKIRDIEGNLETKDKSIGFMVENLFHRSDSDSSSISNNVASMLTSLNMVSSTVTTISQSVSSNEGNLGTLQNNVDMLLRDIVPKVDAKVGANTGKLEMLHKSVGTLTTDVDTINTNVNSNGVKISALEGKLTGSGEKLHKLVMSVGAVDDKVDSNGSKLDTLKDNVDDLKLDVGTLSTNVNSNVDKISDLDVKVTGSGMQLSELDNDLEALDEKVVINGGKLDTLQNNVVKLGLDVGTLGTNVIDNGGKIDSLDVKVTASREELNELVNDLEILDDKVDTNKGKLDLLLNNVGIVGADVIALDGKLSITKTDIEAKIDENAEKIHRIEQILAENTQLQKENSRLLRKLFKVVGRAPPAKFLHGRHGKKRFHW